MSHQEILWNQTAAYRCGLSLPRHEGRNTLGRHGSSEAARSASRTCTYLRESQFPHQLLPHERQTHTHTHTTTLLLKDTRQRSDVEQVYHAAAVVSHRLLRRLALGRRRRELLAQRELVLVQL
eukprot:scaffold96212_cov65-Phaeocystis_antarctica.AAC.1